MIKVLKVLRTLSLMIVFIIGTGFVSNVKAADYYIDTYSDGISVWVVDTEKTGRDSDKYIADVKFVYPP